MDYDRELKLIGFKNKFMITLKLYLYNIEDTNFLHCILDILKKKYKEVDDWNFLEKIRENIHPTNIKNLMYNLNGIVYNYRNESLLNDIIQCIDITINYEIKKSIHTIEATVLNTAKTTNNTDRNVNINQDILLCQNEHISIIQENTNK